MYELANQYMKQGTLTHTPTHPTTPTLPPHTHTLWHTRNVRAGEPRISIKLKFSGFFWNTGLFWEFLPFKVPKMHLYVAIAGRWFFFWKFLAVKVPKILINGAISVLRKSVQKKGNFDIRDVNPEEAAGVCVMNVTEMCVCVCIIYICRCMNCKILFLL